MSVLEIILLSLLAGGFISALIAVAAYLIYVSLKLRTLVTDLRAALAQSSSSQLKLKDDTVRAIGDERTAIMIAFTKMNDELSGMIRQLNGEKLMEAAKQNLIAAGRMEKTYVAIQELLSMVISDKERAAAVAEGTDEQGYAKVELGEGAFVVKSAVAAGDEQANRETYE